MKLIRHLTSFHSEHDSVITIGNFDAIHRGHQLLIEKLISAANEKNLTPTLITFEPLPAEFFSDTPPARLCTFKEKWQHLKKWPIKNVICFRFNKPFSHLSAHDFVKIYLVDKLRIKQLIIGEGFRFGYQQQGDISLLQQLGKQYYFTVEIVPALSHQKKRISSTDIRKKLDEGHLENIPDLLNRFFTLSGRVTKGHQRGRELGFPTANIPLRRKKSPLQGVYAVKVHGIQDIPLSGVANIGHRPTLNSIVKPLLEVHLFNFNQTIYGKKITVEFIQKIRNEKRFESLQDLKNQIQQDTNEAKKILGYFL